MIAVRALLNRWRRALVQALLHRVAFGEHSVGGFRPLTRIAPTTCIDHADGLNLADNVYIGPFNLLDASGGITVEEGVQITSHCSIVTHSSHRSMRLLGASYVHAPQPRPAWIAGPVRIGAYSFIGPHSLIEAGTVLGRGTLVCAGSVVRGEFPPFAVLRGNPAQVVGDTRTADAALLAELERLQPEEAARLRSARGAWAEPVLSDHAGTDLPFKPLRYVLIGDGLSPHLLKWAQTLHDLGGSELQLHVVSSRGLLPEWEALVPPERRLLLQTNPRASGGNVGLLWHLPRVARWLKAARPHVLHAHYLTSHGTLAWLAQRLWRVQGLLVSSAWGSDVLVTPQRSAWMRRLTAAVLKASAVTTSDSHHMAARMKELGARHVRVFPFGLSTLPPESDPARKDPHLYFSNRALEPLYRIDRVLELFAAIAAVHPQARLVVAHQGSERAALQAQARRLGLMERIEFVGLLSSGEQALQYARAQWHLSLPHSDSVSVSVIEAMAHGCIPVLSDLPANRELVEHGRNGWILLGTTGGEDGTAAFLEAQADLLQRASAIARSNRAWVSEHALFAPQVQRFLAALPLHRA